MNAFEIWIAKQPKPAQQTFKALINLDCSYSSQFEKESILEIPHASLEQDFCIAATEGNLQAIQGWLEKQGGLINSRENDSQRTALHLACINQKKNSN